MLTIRTFLFCTCAITLAVHLAKESYFGKLHMSYCTFKGIGNLPDLPEEETKKLKKLLHEICVPCMVTSTVDFEKIYKNCLEAVVQSCKALYKQHLAGEPLD